MTSTDPSSSILSYVSVHSNSFFLQIILDTTVSLVSVFSMESTSVFCPVKSFIASPTPKNMKSLSVGARKTMVAGSAGVINLPPITSESSLIFPIGYLPAPAGVPAICSLIMSCSHETSFFVFLSKAVTVSMQSVPASSAAFKCSAVSIRTLIFSSGPHSEISENSLPSLHMHFSSYLKPGVNAFVLKSSKSSPPSQLTRIGRYINLVIFAPVDGLRSG